jgi:hypothetical protein
VLMTERVAKMPVELPRSTVAYPNPPRLLRCYASHHSRHMGVRDEGLVPPSRCEVSVACVYEAASGEDVGRPPPDPSPRIQIRQAVTPHTRVTWA